MSWWADQAGHFPLLTPAQEITLGTAVRTWLDHPDPVPPAVIRQGRRARDRFICCNLRLVLNFAERYRPIAAEHMPDLIQAGNEGLIRAVEKFDPTRGYKFSTYGYWWIRQGIHSWLEDHGRSIRLPSTHAAQFSAIQNKLQQLIGELGRPPKRSEIAEALGWSLETLERVLQRPVASLSLDAPARAMDDAGSISEVIAAPLPDQLEVIATMDQLDAVMAALVTLPEQLQRLLTDQYLQPRPSSISELARREGLDRQRVSRLIAYGLNRLRMAMASSSIAPPLQQPATGVTYGEQLSLLL